jgi:vitamin B12 transporter
MKKILLLTGLLLSPALLFAQQKKLSLNEVVVTANKFDQKASQTGKVVTVITQKELEHNSGKTLTAILNEQPGITINGTQESPGTNQTVYMRGADPKYTLIMINGIPVNDVSYNDYKFDLNLIPVSSIERIEIMRGGYSTLYGSGATAGVINIITKKGGDNPFNVTAGLSGGSYGTFREQAGINGSKNHVDYNIQFQNFDSKGFSSALDTTGHAGFDKDGFHRKSVFANIGFHPDEKWTISPYLNFAYEKGDLDGGAFTDAKDYTYNTTFFQTGVQIKHDFEKGDLAINYSYNPTERHYLEDSVEGQPYQKEYYRSQTHSVDAYAHFIMDPHISFLIGNEFRLEKTTQSSDYMSGTYVSKSALSADSAQTDAMNIYGSLFLHSNNGFHVEIGGRLNQDKLNGFHPVFSINPSWLINNRVKAFANFSSSYVAPSLYQLYSIYGNQNLNPETGLNYEAGIQTLLADQKLKLRLTGFDRNMRKVIAFQLMNVATGAYQYVNYDHQHDDGGEFELNYAANEHLQFTAYYAYVAGQVKVRNDNTKLDSTYNNLFKRPEHSAGMTASWQITPSFYVGLDGKYTGSRNDLTFAGYAQEVLKLKGYALFNFYAQYIWKKKYKIFVSLQNITNSHYVETTGFATKGFNFDAGIHWSLF